MKLRVKNLRWFAGRPVVFLHEKTAKAMNIFVNDRVSLTNSKRIYAVVDIFSEVVKEDEVGFSKEVSNILKLRNRKRIEVQSSEMSNAIPLIKKKIEGKNLTDDELDFLISEVVHNNLAEAEIAYFTAAQKMGGMTMKETIALTDAMVDNGVRLKFKGKYVVDKHCVGGVSGNRTTPLVVSICAAAGLVFPKTSSRAITSAAGTADVVETITKVALTLSEIKKVVKKTGACLAWGGSLGLAPSDDKIIKVERMLNLDIPAQMLASIMSKKVSAGAKYLIIDIPYGRGSKVSSLQKAKILGAKFKELAREFKIKLKVLYTNGSQPIGNGLGPVLEMLDIVSILRRESSAPRDLKEKSLYLSSELMAMCGIRNARKKARELLDSGKAYEKFKEIINAQNGANTFNKRVEQLKPGKFQSVVKAERSGRITCLSNKGLNSLCRVLGTPETRSAGVYLHKHRGLVKKGEILMTLYSESRSKIRDAGKFIKQFKPFTIT